MNEFLLCLPQWAESCWQTPETLNMSSETGEQTEMSVIYVFVTHEVVMCDLVCPPPPSSFSQVGAG